MLPFNPALGNAPDTDSDDDQDDLLDLNVEGDVDEGGDNDDAGEGDNSVGKKKNQPDDDDFDLHDVDDDNINELTSLGPKSRELMEDTAVVRATISKLRRLSFFIVRSTTGALPQWLRYCKESELKPRIFPRDVVTRWNSTYDMLSFALEYRTAIDAMTADKGLKLRDIELEDEEWLIVGDLVQLLSVSTVICHLLMALTLLHRNTKRQHSISPKILLAFRQLSLPWTR